MGELLKFSVHASALTGEAHKAALDGLANMK